MAFGVTNCHLVQSGRKRDLIKNSDLSGVDPYVFQTYTAFYNHIENSCHFISLELWQENTNQLIEDLHSTSLQALQ